MGKIPKELRHIIAHNIRECRMNKFPGRGGGKKCAEAFGVSPQQWSPWERGMRTPDEIRMSAIAEFFGVSVAYLREDHSPPRPEHHPGKPPFGDAASPAPPPAMNGGAFVPPPPSNRSGNDDIYWLLAKFFSDVREKGVVVRLAPEDIDYFTDRLAEAMRRQGSIRPAVS